MSKLSKIYNHIDKYSKSNTLVCGEEMLTRHAWECGIIDAIGIKKSAFLIRDDEFKNREFGRQW